MDDEYGLITRILSGDAGAWHSFTELYSQQIQNNIERYVREPDVARDLYATLLEKLKKGKLEKFDFKSRLSTWLFIVARNHCKDYFRSTKGVRHILTALEGLSPREERFFKLYYVQGLSLQETFESMRAEHGEALQYLDLFEYRESIRRLIARKKLGRLLEKLLRPSADTVRLDTVGSEFGLVREEMSDSSYPTPESCMDGQNLRIAVRNLRDAILQLPHRDQLVLKLRFEHKRSAREIGEILDLGNEKQVYRKLDRLFDKLRSMLLELGLPDDVYREIAEDIERICTLSGVWEAGAASGGRGVS